MGRFLRFIQSPSSGGIVLIIASVIAVMLANSPYGDSYFHFLHTEVAGLAMHLWINDALMAIFFLYVGLEVKREMMIGQLNTNAKRLYPGLAAFFGFLVPAIIYYGFTMHDNAISHGWAIPAATDIAFALGVLALVERKVPLSLKAFLTALAVIDDLMAIVVIALFYTSNLALGYLGIVAAIIVVLLILNKKNLYHPIVFLLLGIALWYCVFRSGLHATLAGVILALTIPLTVEKNGEITHPLISWEHALSASVTFLIIPIFGFANAGVSFGSTSLSDLTHPVVLGIALGLFIGKQVGIFGLSLTLIKFGIVPMPSGAKWRHVYGVSMLCGIGFTMSLFVAMLSFAEPIYMDYAKIGVFVGSIGSAVAASLLLMTGKDVVQ